MFPRRASSHPLPALLRQRQVAIPLVFSLVVHAALIAALVSWRLDLRQRPEHLSETGSSTVLNLAIERPPPQRPPEPRPEPKPATPPPEPTPAPKPEPTHEPTPIEPAKPAPPAHDAIALAPVESKSVAPSPPASPPAPPPPTEPTPPPPEPKVSFAGVESKRAIHIVYAIDASGSMASSLPFVKAELARSVAKLDPSQSFAVVVFRDKLGGGESIETFAAGNVLLAATPRAKSDLARWLATIEPSGRSNTVAGLRSALALKPDLILLLTRNIRRSGRGNDADANAAPLASLNALNPLTPPGAVRPVVIKVVQFIEDDPTGLMQAIAETHGDGPGSYRVVPVE